MSQVKAIQRPQTESCLFRVFSLLLPKITSFFWRTPNSESNRWCTASLNSNHIQNSIICNSTKTEKLGILCLSSLSHILVRAFMHFMTNEVEKGRKETEYSGLWNRFNLFCQNRLQSVASLLECSESPFSLCVSLLPIIAIWHSPFLCRPGSVTLTQAFFRLCRLLPTSLVQTYDHPSWIKHYTPPYPALPVCPLDTARAGNGSISAANMLIKLATYYQNETLREAAALFVRSN